MFRPGNLDPERSLAQRAFDLSWWVMLDNLELPSPGAASPR